MSAKPRIRRYRGRWEITYPARTVICDTWADALAYVATHDSQGEPE